MLRCATVQHPIRQVMHLRGTGQRLRTVLVSVPVSPFRTVPLHVSFFAAFIVNNDWRFFVSRGSLAFVALLLLRPHLHVQTHTAYLWLTSALLVFNSPPFPAPRLYFWTFRRWTSLAYVLSLAPVESYVEQNDAHSSGSSTNLFSPRARAVPVRSQFRLV